jgi:hypothetical protein
VVQTLGELVGREHVLRLSKAFIEEEGGSLRKERVPSLILVRLEHIDHEMTYVLFPMTGTRSGSIPPRGDRSGGNSHAGFPLNIDSRFVDPLLLNQHL